MNHETVAIGGVSMTLLLYTIIASTGILLNWGAVIFAVSSVLITWMVWIVLKHGNYNGEELEDEQEFGYVNRPELTKQEI